MSKKTLGGDQKYFEGQTTAFMIATSRRKPLLFCGAVPIYWSRAVAVYSMRAWMKRGGCVVVKVRISVVRGRRNSASRQERTP